MKIETSLLCLWLVAACKPSTPPQPPTNDVTPPTTNTGDGQVMGADQKPPAEKLDEGPQIDSQKGLKPGTKPAGD